MTTTPKDLECFMEEVASSPIFRQTLRQEAACSFLSHVAVLEAMGVLSSAQRKTCLDWLGKARPKVRGLKGMGKRLDTLMRECESGKAA